MFSEYIVFTDESGDHSLESIDPIYPMFVLSFCLIRKSVYVDELTPKLRTLKMKTWGHDLAILHEYDLRKKKKAFSKMSETARADFMESLAVIVQETDFKLFAVVIDKLKHKAKYFAPEHPYHMAMQFGLERIHGYLKIMKQQDLITHFVFEARGKNEDRELELAFRRVCDGSNFQSCKLPFELIIADKLSNSEGLQLADLTARPIGLSILRPEQPNRARDILESKFSTHYGRKNGIGLKVFP